MSNKATITKIGVQTGTTRTVFITWTWSKSNTESYKVKWWYATGDGVWFVGSESDEKDKQSIYNAPANAYKVSVQVKPISETKKVDDKEVSYWTASWSTAMEYYFEVNPPTTPPVPSVSVKNNILTARVENLDVNANEIEFQIVQNDNKVYKTGIAKIVTSAASFSATVIDGNEYKVRCRAKRSYKYSSWSEYSNNSEIKLKPSTPGVITECASLSKTSVRLKWGASPTAKTYTIEYATEKDHLGASNASTSITNVETTTYIVTGLETGHKYFFRIRAVNEAGESGWSEISSVLVGTDPEAPTTWSSTTTAVVGDIVYLYWVHNSEDGSIQKQAELELVIDGNKTVSIITNHSESEETTIYELKTNNLVDGATINWRVRTMGVTNEYGEWSLERTIDVYSRPALAITMTDGINAISTLTEFPFYITGITGPVTQKPIGYHTTIIANDSYETVDEFGNVKTVSKGQEVYSKFHDIEQNLNIKLTPSEVDLENNMSYKVTCVVTMDSGLNAEDELFFNVAWSDDIYDPNAEISFDPDTLCAYIRPYCDYYPIQNRRVIYDDITGKFYRTDDVIPQVSGVVVHDSYTDEYNDVVKYGRTSNGEKVYYCEAESSIPELIEGVSLSVYRREYDGSFTELITGLRNTDNTFATDPHPALDYARYRIVAISDKTGAMGYTDIPGLYVGEKSVVIQWDEQWDNFDTTNEDLLETPSWAGSMIKLPYNIDVSDNTSIDVSMIEYIGRSHPVSYYGTQLGVKSSWKVDIPKDDKQTLYALRRLAIYRGDVYVREPSGTGYWACIGVSFSQTHCEMVIPVSLDITRVEGGI